MDSQDIGRFWAESLHFAAKRYKLLGFSVIPVNGASDPERPKLPAIKWGRYQHVQPDDTELEDWFLRRQYRGLAVVCGRVSRLVVLDFDDEQHASEFRRIAPDLANTFEVRSGGRRLPHFYWRIPEGLLVPTRACEGADLRGEGSYVVAAPTQVAGGCWQVVNEVEPRLLSEGDLRRVLRFLAALTPVSARKRLGRSSSSIASYVTSPADASEFRRIKSADDLVCIYRELIPLGRNNALFRVACAARDSGWEREQVVLALAVVHAQQAGPMSESHKQRYAEAVRTIASAFGRPPRQRFTRSVGLSNAVREWLLKQGLVSVARVLDGLYAAGLKAGQIFTERLACDLLSVFHIGRRSVMAALKASVNGIKAIFSGVSTSLHSPLNPPEEANAANNPENLKNSCQMSTGAKRVKTGRPAYQYVLPSPVELAEKIGVQGVQSDVLQSQDLSSPKAYRQALHRELLSRRPGQYPRQWLGARIGVSKWTTRRYESALNVRVQPVYHQENLRWSNLQTRLPEKKADAPPGTFIEDASGKRYPPLRAIAARLLKRGETICLKRREVNYYTCGQVTCVGIPTHVSRSSHLSEKWSVDQRPDQPLKSPSSEGATSPDGTCVGIPTHLDDRLSFWYCPHCLNHDLQEAPPAECRRCGAQHSWERLPKSIWRDTEALKRWWQNLWREHQRANHRDTALPRKWESHQLEPEAQALAQRAQATVHNLSLRNARTLVRQYGQEAVERGLILLAARQGIRSPAAFLVTVLKSEYKLLSNNSIINKQRSTPQGYRDWAQQMAASPYADFLVNKEDVIGHNAVHIP